MEPIRLLRWRGAWPNVDEYRRKVEEPTHEQRRLWGCEEYAALPRAEYDALVRRVENAEVAARVCREDAEENAARAERAERDRDAYRRAKAENDERYMVERDAATARAEKAEADQRMLHFLQDAAKHPGNAELLRALRDLGCDQPAGDPVKMVFIHSPRAFHAPTPDDRKGEDGAWCERGCE